MGRHRHGRHGRRTGRLVAALRYLGDGIDDAYCQFSESDITYE